MQISPGTTRFFPSICLPHLLHLSPCSYGLWLVMQSYPQTQPYMRFLYVRPEVCPRVSRFPESGFLQTPPHDGHPCLQLCPSHYRADSGLAPVRNVRRRAHTKKATAYQAMAFHACDRIRTRGLLVRSQTLYPAELHAHNPCCHNRQQRLFYPHRSVLSTRK